MTEKPDLPILENVSASLSSETDHKLALRKNLRLLQLNVILIAAGLLLLSTKLTGKQHSQDFIDNLADYMGVVFLLLFGFDGLRKRLTGVFYWQTSSEGILSKGFFRSKFIPWLDIESTKLAFTCTGYRLITRKGAFEIPQDPSNWTLNLLGTSIWQHLRRQGKPDTLEAPYTSKLLWKKPEIRTAEWKLPKPIGTYFIYLLVLTLVSVVLFTVVICSLMLDINHLLMIFLITVASLLVWIWPLNSLYKHHKQLIRHIKVTEDKILFATGRETIELAIHDVMRVEWRLDQLHLHTSTYALAIPYKLYNKDSKSLLLAIISRLSAIEHPQLLATPRAIIEPPIPPLTGDLDDVILM